MDHIGIDMHKRESQISVLAEGGEGIERRIRTEPERFAAVLGGRPRARIVIEASTDSEWVARCLEVLGHEVIVADPNFAPMYATRTRKVKTDRRDARALGEACLLGVEVRARAGSTSFRRGERLEQLLAEATAQVEALKREVHEEPQATTRRLAAALCGSPLLQNAPSRPSSPGGHPAMVLVLTDLSAHADTRTDEDFVVMDDNDAWFPRTVPRTSTLGRVALDYCYKSKEAGRGMPMRERVQQGSLSLHVIAGTYVVLLGFNVPEGECDGLLGFSIHRTDHTENEAYFLEGMKAFAETDPGFPSGSTYSTDDHPIQSFQWADYSAKPGHRYTYKVTARKGTPATLTDFAEASITITTESPEGGDHDIYFNRGLAASQAYVRRFGNRAPNLVENNQAFIWLSRGIYEAMSAFMHPAEPARHAFLIAAYEFHYRPFLDVIRAAANRSDVKIIYDARKDPSDNPEKPSLTDKNRAAVAAAALGDISRERRANKSYIAHNKFIVRLKDGVPQAVWTGGTNFSEGGIFGHSNVAHVVEDPEVAGKFKDYWMLLADDPTNATLKPQVSDLTPIPPGHPTAGTIALFSPRPGLDLLKRYADFARGAQQGLFMTFAFGMNDLWKDVYRTAAAPLRFALMEAKTRAMEDGPEKEAEERAINDLRRLNENVFAIGAFIRTNQFDGWVKERLTGLNSNVKYVHNKFMLIDPLGDEPMVIAGSANFSEASTDKNDENMLIVRGNSRVADIYLGEFMRLYSHHAFRESLTFTNANPDPKPLRTDDWWRDYFGGSSRSLRREFFS